MCPPQVHGMVKTGKEAHVYHALAPEDTENLTGIRGVALKIFKTTLNEFGNRAAYVDGDPRLVPPPCFPPRVFTG